eukprot:gene22348-29440_t
MVGVDDDELSGSQSDDSGSQPPLDRPSAKTISLGKGAAQAGRAKSHLGPRASLLAPLAGRGPLSPGSRSSSKSPPSSCITSPRLPQGGAGPPSAPSSGPLQPNQDRPISMSSLAGGSGLASQRSLSPSGFHPASSEQSMSVLAAATKAAIEFAERRKSPEKCLAEAAAVKKDEDGEGEDPAPVSFSMAMVGKTVAIKDELASHSKRLEAHQVRKTVAMNDELASHSKRLEAHQALRHALKDSWEKVIAFQKEAVEQEAKASRLHRKATTRRGLLLYHAAQKVARRADSKYRKALKVHDQATKRARNVSKLQRADGTLRESFKVSIYNHLELVNRQSTPTPSTPQAGGGGAGTDGDEWEGTPSPAYSPPGPRGWDKVQKVPKTGYLIRHENLPVSVDRSSGGAPAWGLWGDDTSGPRSRASNHMDSSASRGSFDADGHAGEAEQHESQSAPLGVQVLARLSKAKGGSAQMSETHERGRGRGRGRGFCTISMPSLPKEVWTPPQQTPPRIVEGAADPKICESNAAAGGAGTSLRMRSESSPVVGGHAGGGHAGGVHGSGGGHGSAVHSSGGQAGGEHVSAVHSVGEQAGGGHQEDETGKTWVTQDTFAESWGFIGTCESEEEWEERHKIVGCGDVEGGSSHEVASGRVERGSSHAVASGHVEGGGSHVVASRHMDGGISHVLASGHVEGGDGNQPVNSVQPGMPLDGLEHAQEQPKVARVRGVVSAGHQGTAMNMSLSWLAGDRIRRHKDTPPVSRAKSVPGGERNMRGRHLSASTSFRDFQLGLHRKDPLNCPPSSSSVDPQPLHRPCTVPEGVRRGSHSSSKAVIHSHPGFNLPPRYASNPELASALKSTTLPGPQKYNPHTDTLNAARSASALISTTLPGPQKYNSPRDTLDATRSASALKSTTLTGPQKYNPHTDTLNATRSASALKSTTLTGPQKYNSPRDTLNNTRSASALKSIPRGVPVVTGGGDSTRAPGKTLATPLPGGQEQVGSASALKSIPRGIPVVTGGGDSTRVPGKTLATPLPGAQERVGSASALKSIPRGIPVVTGGGDSARVPGSPKVAGKTLATPLPSGQERVGSAAGPQLPFLFRARIVPASTGDLQLSQGHP